MPSIDYWLIGFYMGEIVEDGNGMVLHDSIDELVAVVNSIHLGKMDGDLLVIYRVLNDEVHIDDIRHYMT